MRRFGIVLAVALMLVMWRGVAGQGVPLGSQVRVTIRDLGPRVGLLVFADSSGLAIVPDGSDQPLRVAMSAIEAVEVSRLHSVSATPTWAVVLAYGVAAGGAWYGATGWGHHARPKGVLGGVLGAVAGGGVAGIALEPWLEMEKSEQRWERVPVPVLLIPTKAGGRLKPALGPGGGRRGIAFGVSVSF
jgi:hypothetical protein